MQVRARARMPVAVAAAAVAAAVAAVAAVGAPAGASLPGDRDRSFGGDGEVTIARAGKDVSVVQVSPLAGGAALVEIVSCVPSTTTCAVELVRLKSDGTADQSWAGGAGSAAVPFPGPGAAQPRVIVQPDGKIVAFTATSPAQLLRFTASGLPDSGFGGGDGEVSVGAKLGAALLPDGTFRVVGPAQGATAFGMGKVSAGGVVDGAFGTVSLPVPANDHAQLDDVQALGSKVVVLGELAHAGRADETAVLAYEGDGSPSAFGSNGVYSVRQGQAVATATLSADPAGVTVAGTVPGASVPQPFFVRLGAGGQPAPGFGAGGYVQVDSEDTFAPTAAAHDPSHGEVTVVRTDNGFVAARVSPDGGFDDAYGLRPLGFASGSVAVAVGPGRYLFGGSRVAQSRRVGVVSAQTIDGSPSGSGYRFVAADGGIFTFGDAGFYGSTGAVPLNQPIVGMASTPSGKGYWLVASDGGIFSFGDAGFHGSAGALRLNRPVLAMASTPSGNGYWCVASDGGIFAYGDAGFYGSTGATKLNAPIVGMAATPTGRGYWLVAADGGVFSFGDAPFRGSAARRNIDAPIVAIVPTPSGQGYWIVGADGVVDIFGDATFVGDLYATPLNRPIVGMEATPDGGGYWLVASDGGIFSFGDATFFGSTGAVRLNRPIVGMAA